MVKTENNSPRPILMKAEPDHNPPVDLYKSIASKIS